MALNLSMEQSQIPSIIGNTKLHHRIHKRRTAVPTLSQSNPIRASLSNFLKVYFNIVFPLAVTTEQGWRKQPTQHHTGTRDCMCSNKKLLMMDTIVSETCRAAWSEIKYFMILKLMCIWLVFIQYYHMKCLVTSFLRLGVVSTSLNSHLGRPTLVGRPKLLFNIWAATVLCAGRLVLPQPEGAPCCRDRAMFIMEV
jgi:hypothetical protein